VQTVLCASTILIYNLYNAETYCILSEFHAWHGRVVAESHRG